MRTVRTRIGSLLLALAMLLTMLPATVLAADGTTASSGKVVNETTNVEYTTLEDAVKAASAKDVLAVYPGNYNIKPGVTSVAGQPGDWYLALEKSITIKGVDAEGKEITDASQTQANIYSTSYTSNGSWASQNLITVFADDVTISGVTIMNKVEANKGIEVVAPATNFTVKSCTFAPIAEELLPEGGKVMDGEKVVYDYATHKDYGSGVYFNGQGKTGDDAMNVTVTGNIFDRSCITLDSTVAGTFEITGNEFNGKKMYAGYTYSSIGYTSWATDPATGSNYVTLGTADVSVSGNEFNDTGVVNFAKVTDSTSASPDFSGNYWGENATASTIASMVSGNVKIDNYYTDPEMTEDSKVDVADNTILVGSVSDLKTALNRVDNGDTIILAAGTYDVGNLRINKAVSLQGAGKDQTKLVGSIGYYCEDYDGTIKVSDLTVQAPADNTTTQQAIWWSYNTANPLDGAQLVVEDCAVVDYVFAIGVNSSTKNCTLTATGLTLDNVWCGANVSEGAGNKVAAFEVTGDSTVVYEVQVFSGSYNGYYKTYEDCVADTGRTNPAVSGNDSMPSVDNWPSVAKIGDKYYGSLQAAVDAAVAGEVIELTDDVTLTAAVNLATGDDITINGNGKTITFPVTVGGGNAFYIPSSAENVTLKVNNVVFETADDSNLSDGKPVSGFAILVGEATNNVAVSADKCSFSDLWCGVYFGHVAPGKSGSVSITNSTYDNVKYGYSIDEVTTGSAANAVKPTFTGNTGVETASEPWANITLTHDGATTVYNSLAAAIEDAVAGDTITLNKDVTESVTIDKTITINGNGHKIAPATGTAVNVTAGGVVLNDVCAVGSGSNGYGLTVDTEGDITVNGGSYTTTDANLQGAGAMRIFADGKVVVKNTTTVGGIHVFNPASYEIADNTVGFTYTGETPFVGILVYYDALPESVNAEAEADSLMAGNQVSVPNTASDFVQIAENWDNKGEVPAEDNVVAQIGSNLYASLQTAVDVVANNGTITLIADCAENVTVSRVVTFTIAKNADVEFTGSVSAGSGYRVTEKNGTYTVEEHIPSGGGSGTSGFAVTVEKATNGTVTASTSRAAKGTKVTLTVKPNDGYVLDTITVKDASGNTVSLTKDSDTKYTFTMPASAVTVKATFVDEGLPFTDVSGHWALDAIEYVYENGMMNGTTSTKFGPEAQLTRGMIVTILYRLEGEPAVSGNTFADVNPSQYYADPIAWAAKNGIVTGYDETTFGPENSITREQLAAILYRYASYKGYDVTKTADLSVYADADSVSAYAKDAMSWANAEGLITGVTTTTLNPKGTATRAQVATILMRFCENIAK